MKYNKDDDASADAVRQTFRQVCSALDAKLTEQGYLIVQEKDDDKVFGSRYVVWSNNNDALRFTWDGKEGMFLLEVADALPLSSASLWDEIILVSCDPENHDESYVSSIMKKIIASLE